MIEPDEGDAVDSHGGDGVEFKTSGSIPIDIVGNDCIDIEISRIGRRLNLAGFVDSGKVSTFSLFDHIVDKFIVRPVRIAVYVAAEDGPIPG